MKTRQNFKKWLRSFTNLVMIICFAGSFMTTLPVAIANTPDPTSVTVVGSLQSELGCPGDWQPECAATHLSYDGSDDVWQAVFTVPAGNWEYKAALNDSWVENYGANAAPNGGNIPLNLGATTDVKFYYDHKTHWITDNVNSVIAVVPGSFQSELGCPGDWQPDCLRSWLQDVDGDGSYTFSTLAIPPGSYEGKVSLNESWDVNYGQGGVQNGPNIAFAVPVANSTVDFAYDSTTHVLTITVTTPPPPPEPALDNNVEWDGLRHDSRDSLYRTPGGAVPAGTPVSLRFRTFHNDVNKVVARIYDVNSGAQRLEAMSLAASDESCYQAGLEDKRCDYWSVTLSNPDPNNLWYRFIITDGTDTDYYADNTSALDGGLGSTSEDAVDTSFALMVYDPAFTTPAWAEKAVVYQIFPDRFRNGRKGNDAQTGDLRYDDPVLELAWNTLPEGYCRFYDDADENCPWRFGEPEWGIDLPETPRGRDYMGGDLRGVDQKLEYLASLGVNTLYFNPIFDAGSNHGYDTQDYYQVDPYFGTQKDWTNLVKHATKLGMRIVLDGVYNHMSSDSAFFDRYQRYDTLGACESVDSPYRAWFTFHEVAAGTGACAGSAGPLSANYDSWFGFDSIPVLNKSLPEIQAYFLTADDGVARYWLLEGASGWRLDVMGDASFPSGYWESFREAVKETRSDALIIGELWQKDTTLLRFLRGDRADTTMNYRFRDAVVGFLTPGPFDSKGFGDSGRIISPSEFISRLASIREDYPDAAYYSLMNLLDSHDTERILWALTPGGSTTEDKELNAANLAEGKRKQQIASLIQFSMPGAPTIFYGDEVGMTGDDDPDDRRTYPWLDLGGAPDMDLFAHYQVLANLRRSNLVLTKGDLRILLANDTSGVVAYGRKTTSQAALVVINRSSTAQTASIPLAGYLPDGIPFTNYYPVGNTVPVPGPVSGGILTVTLEPLSAWLLITGQVDLLPTAAPENLKIVEGNALLDVSWDTVPGAAGYNLYRSPLSGGGWQKVNPTPLMETSLTDTGLVNGKVYFYVVTALDSAGNESAFSAEASGMPHLVIGWANLQWPYTMTHVISTLDRTETAYGQVWIDGATSLPGVTPSLIAQLGFGPEGSNPGTNPGWSWVDAVFNVDAGNNDEFMASMLPEAVGTFDYVYRYSTTSGRDWLYADLNGPVPAGDLPPNPGKLTVSASGDTTPPVAPTNLHVVSASIAEIGLTWDEVLGDVSLYGYEVLRGTSAGGPYIQVARVTVNTYTDTDLAAGTTYFYVVRALDTSFNRSGYSNEVSAVAEPRTVTLNFNVTVPSTTDATGLSVYIAGYLDRLDGNLPQWDPGGVVLTRVDATHWTIALTGKETVQIEYKYTLGSWDFVEKDSACGEINNRLLTLSYGSSGSMTINDTVLNWRSVSPCP